MDLLDSELDLHASGLDLLDSDLDLHASSLDLPASDLDLEDSALELRPRKSSAERTTRWDVLVSNLKPNLPDMPHVADDTKKLDDMLTQARALETQQENLRSQARKASAELKQVLREGDKLRSHLGSNLKGKFGFTDETLVKYGFRPRSTAVRRRKKTDPTTPPPAGAQHGTASQGTAGTASTTGAK